MKMVRYAFVAFLACTCSAMAFAQGAVNEKHAFEVSSIRPTLSGGNTLRVTPTQLTITSFTVAACIKWAYGLQDGQISSGNSVPTALLNSERYDIVAKTNEPVSENELKLMMQGLLSERFHLAFHTETRSMRAYALVVEKNGPKFHESTSDGEGKQVLLSKVNRQWKWTTMAKFADNLSEAMQAPVVDQTGLHGKYDFGLDLTSYLPTGGEQPDLVAMLITGIREQLGLSLEPRRLSAEVMVIDHLEKATEN